MLSRKKKSRSSAAGMINSAKDYQTLKSGLHSENSGLNVGKESPMIMPLSRRKRIATHVKRKAETSNYKKTANVKRARHASKNNLGGDVLSVDNTNLAGEETQSSKNNTNLADEETRSSKSNTNLAGEETQNSKTNTNLAGEETQSSKNKVHNAETSDVLKGGCALHDVLQSHSFSQAIKLLKEDYPLSQDDLDKALILACQGGHTYIIQKLVDLGADVNCRSADENTPLMICSKNGFAYLVQFLLRRKADVNAANFAGDTALILCIYSPGPAAILKLLLQHKEINIDHQNGQGYTALMKAVEMFDFSTAYNLLAHHFVANKRQYNPWWKVHHQIVNFKGETTAAMFENCGFRKMLEMFEQYIKVKFGDYDEIPFDLNIEAYDLDLMNSFFNSTGASLSDRECIASEVLIKLFKRKINEVKMFSKNEITMVERLLILGAKDDYYSSAYPVCIATEAGSYPLVELLCQHSFDVNKPNNHHSTPLSIAAREDRPDLIELLLQHKADINNKLQYKGSALDIALSNGHMRCAKLLIQKGAVVDIPLALVSAVSGGTSCYIDFLFEHYEHRTRQCLINSSDDLLLLAVKTGNIDIIKQVLEAGADINREHCSVTPLVLSKNGEVARYLIERGANVNARICMETTYCTPLLKILMCRPVLDLSGLEVVRALLENGASGVCDYKILRVTALINGRVALLQLLLHHGADLCARDTEGNTVLMHSIYRTCPKMALFLINYAKDNKDFLNARNDNGSTALMHAVIRRHVTVVKELIDHGVDVNAKNTDGNTALFYVIEKFIQCDKTCMDILTYLIGAGADVNCCMWGQTVLAMAINRCWNDAIIKLLDAGAGVSVADKHCKLLTALKYLSYSFGSSRSVSCLATLLDRGACASYLEPTMFHKLIVSRYTDMVCKLIRHGFGPVTIKWGDIFAKDELSFDPNTDISPLYRALVSGNVRVATYFMDIMFLTASDMSSLKHDKVLRAYLETKNYSQCLGLLDEMSSQPASLFNLAFLTVSSSVGTAPGRGCRINMLPIPQMMKDKLLFKSQVEDLPRIDNSAQEFLYFELDSDSSSGPDDDYNSNITYGLD